MSRVLERLQRVPGCGRLTKQQIVVLLFAAVCIATVLLAVIIVYGKGTSYESKLYPYPNLVTLGSYTAKKQLFGARWTYNFGGGSVVQTCPTANHDTDLVYNDHLVGRTDKKMFSTVQLTYYRDGMGNLLWVTKSGNSLQSFLNHVTFDVSLLIYDKDEKTLLGYYAGSNFFIGNEVYLSDPQGNKLVRMDRNFPTFGTWEWTVTLLNSTAPAPFNDFRFSAMLAGYVAFEDGDSTDLCNDFFWDASWFLVGVVGLCVLGCCTVGFRLIRNRGRGSTSLSHRRNDDIGHNKLDSASANNEAAFDSAPA